MQEAEKGNVEEALFKWFTLQRSRNLPIMGAILQAKANEFAELFEEKSFFCSNGWLDRFKRHNIRSGKVVGKAASACSSDISHWMENVWPDIIRNSDEKDIFNADETDLFYNLTPNQTLKFKGEKCVGGKLSKVRITILSKTFSVLYKGKTGGLTLDWNMGFALYDTESKCYAWRYKFSQLKGSSDDGKTKLTLNFQDPEKKEVESE
ncbi:Tigger transposable element-derived protein 4, partial [Araneus ventricosus]